MAERLCGAAPGARSFRYRHVSHLSASFELVAEGSDDEGRLWFHASLLEIRRDALLWNRVEVAPRVRRRRISKRLAAGLWDVANLVGVTALRVDAEHMGGYAWARAGFEPDAASWLGLTDHLVRAIARLGRHLAPDRAHFVQDLIIRRRGEPDALLALARLEDRVPDPQPTDHMNPGAVPLGLALLAGAEWSGSIPLARGPARRRFEEWLTE